MSKKKLSEFEKALEKHDGDIDELIKDVKRKHKGKAFNLALLKKIGVAVDSERDMTSIKNSILHKEAIHLLIAPTGYGKTTTAIKLAGATDYEVIYLDFELNPTTKSDPYSPKSLCEKYGVVYSHADNEYDAISSILELGVSMKGIILVIDTYSSLINEGNNDATETKNIVNKFLKLVTELKATVIIIDHATQGERSKIDIGETEFDFKTEGNASGKKKLADFTFKLQPVSGGMPSSGMMIKVDKSRNQKFLPMGEVLTVIDSEGGVVDVDNMKVKRVKSSIYIKPPSDNVTLIIETLQSKGGELPYVDLETILCPDRMVKGTLRAIVSKEDNQEEHWTYEKAKKGAGKIVKLHSCYKGEENE